MSARAEVVGRVPSRGDSTALTHEGYAIVEDDVPNGTVAGLIGSLDSNLSDASSLQRRSSVYGGRNLLRDIPLVREFAESETVRSLVEPILGTGAFAVRGLFFDKTSSANWPVNWHQDRTIAVREKRETKGFGPWTVKAGVPHVQPPIEILENMLTVRLHLDNCDETNGPLRVIAGSHRAGFLDAEAIASWTASTPAMDCLLGQGGIVLMRPLLLHSSARATRPHHRRVIHLEFASETLPYGLEWFESLHHGRS